MRRRGPTLKDERGAVMVMSVLLMTVLLTFTAFAVDIGTQRVARADMQALADVIALDAARQLDGRTAGALTADLEAAKVTAVTRNGTTVGVEPKILVIPGKVGKEFITADNLDGFVAVQPSDVPTAVRVIAETSVGFAFAPGRGNAARSAIASGGEATTCFSVSPTALALNTSGGALGPVLDQILKVNFKVLSPQGLLTLQGTEVPLADIALELGVGTPQELLALSNVSLRDFSLASARALSKNGFTAQAAALNAVAAQISGGTVNVGRILSLDTGGGAAGLAAGIDVFDLVTGAVFAANGTSSVNVKGLSLVVPGLGGVQELSIVITEPPQIACGKAGVTAKSAQLRLRLRSGIDPLGISATNVNLDLDLDLGRGEGTLKSLTCGAQPSAVITAKSGLALGAASLRFNVLQLLSLLAVEAQLSVTAGQGGPRDLTFAQPAGGSGSAPQSVTATTSVLSLQTTGVTATVLGLPVGVGGLLNAVVLPLVNGPVNALLSAVLYPVLSLLGLTLGRADIATHGNIDCQTVKLVG